MKRLLVLVIFAVSLVSVSLPATAAYDENELVPVSRTFLIKGVHQRYIPFPFEVPWGASVWEYKRSFPFFGQQAKWELKYAGENVGAGIYRFESTGDGYFQIQTEIKRWMLISGGGFLEIEPEDLGLLVKNGNVPSNVFDLSTDDRQFSYELIRSAIGSERTLDSFMSNTYHYADSGKGIVGAVIADSRGFLVKKVMFADQESSSASILSQLPKGIINNPWVQKLIKAAAAPEVKPSDIIVHEGDVVVLIRAEFF
ncbi:MAG: hypothetical protein ACD_5C00056G0003 [uncultured bacterium]|nr:MAG: hypothetical protein ACD_5C00056G0003 [uncultured bacterium]